MKWLRMLAVAAAVLAGQATVCATAQAQAAAPSPRAVELAERMMKVVGIERQVDAMVAAMQPMTMSQPEFAQLPSKERQIVMDTVREVMRDTFTPELVRKMVPVYAQAFTEDQLAAIVAFYESPAGQAAIQKTPSLVQASVALAQELVPAAQAEIERRVCEKVDCKGIGPPKKS